MKAVMLSIKPKYCELIANGKKTIEVRKTKPKLETPFKCYIYCTNQKIMGEILLRNGKVIGQNKGFRENGDICLSGKIIGEFVCDFIQPLFYHKISSDILYGIDIPTEYTEEIMSKSCLMSWEIQDYLDGKDGYGWHISDLKIYDKPKELSEFYTWKKCTSCKVSGYESTACRYDIDCKVPVPLERPPQSWCYIEFNEGSV